MHAKTLNELMAQNRSAPRSITYHNGENDSHAVSFAELHDRALGILHHLQQLGAKPGDKLILLLSSNEQFIDAFWGGVLGQLGVSGCIVALGVDVACGSFTLFKVGGEVKGRVGNNEYLDVTPTFSFLGLGD